MFIVLQAEYNPFPLNFLVPNRRENIYVFLPLYPTQWGSKLYSYALIWLNNLNLFNNGRKSIDEAEGKTKNTILKQINEYCKTLKGLRIAKMTIYIS